MFGNAEGYQRFMGRWSALVAPLLVELGNVPGEGRVLDAGSGAGSLTFAIAEQKSDVLVQGIDPSKEFVAFATHINPFPERVSFEVGDAQQLRFSDSTFEASLSLLVFNFIPNAHKALGELRRVTKPGGWISAATWDYGDGMKMLRMFWDAAASLDANARRVDEKRMPLCKAGELSRLWKEEGLENVHEQPLDIAMRFESFEDYWNPFLLGQGPAGAYVGGIDEGMRAALRDDLRGRLALFSDSAPFILPARAWGVRGSVPLRQ
jgi:SAM-dependent methyltransferase